MSEDSLRALLRKECREANRQLQPLWERKAGGRRLYMLDTPVLGELTLRDLLADGGGAMLSAMCSRECVDDLRAAHREGRMPTVDDPARSPR